MCYYIQCNILRVLVYSISIFIIELYFYLLDQMLKVNGNFSPHTLVSLFRIFLHLHLLLLFCFSLFGFKNVQYLWAEVMMTIVAKAFTSIIWALFFILLIFYFLQCLRCFRHCENVIFPCLDNTNDCFNSDQFFNIHFRD